MVSWTFLLLAAAAAVGAMLSTRWRRGRRVSAPSCGQCGYEVRGLPSFTCPECGADLREVGIITPAIARGVRRPPSTFTVLLAWSVALGLVAWILTTIVANALPRTSAYTAVMTLARPASQAYEHLTVTAEGKAIPGRPLALAELRFDLVTSTGQASRLTIDGPSLRFGYVDRQTGELVRGTDLDVDAILAWMQSAGVDTSSSQIRAEATELLSLAQLPSALGRSVAHLSSWKTSQQSYSSSPSRPPAWFVLSAAVFWVLLWILGVRRILKRRPPAWPAGSTGPPGERGAI